MYRAYFNRKQRCIPYENPLRQKQNPHQQHRANAIDHHNYGWIGNARRSGTVQIFEINTNLKLKISECGKDQTGALIQISHDKANSRCALWRDKVKDFDTLLITCLDVKAGRWLWIWTDESKPLESNAAGGCFAYHTENTKPNIYGNR